MKDKCKTDYTLYLLTDRSMLRGIALEDAVEQAILGGVTVVQIREKEASALEFYHIALAVKTVTDKYRIPLIINDRLDIALAVNADGLHVGQRDLPAGKARKILGRGKILGVSAATLQEALDAKHNGADYIGVGSVFQTSTKHDVRRVTPGQLAEIKARTRMPVVAVGGINKDNAYKLDGAGIDGIAVASAILGAEDIRKAAEELKEQLKFIK